MTLALAIIQVLIPLLPSITGDISSLVNWISSIRKVTQQTGQWTPALDQSFRAAVIAAGLEDPAYKP
jgi:hypothetical protein